MVGPGVTRTGGPEPGMNGVTISARETQVPDARRIRCGPGGALHRQAGFDVFSACVSSPSTMASTLARRAARNTDRIFFSVPSEFMRAWLQGPLTTGGSSPPTPLRRQVIATR